MAIDQSQVRRIAHLARLALRPDELELYTGQLESILSYIEQLKAVDVSGVEPLSHPQAITDVFRDDAPRESLPIEAALANAPQRQNSFFRVPAVLDPSTGA